MNDPSNKSEAHQAIATCPPCTGNCRQGRDCNAVQRWTKGDGVGVVVGVMLVAIAWTTVLVLLAAALR